MKVDNGPSSGVQEHQAETQKGQEMASMALVKFSKSVNHVVFLLKSTQFIQICLQQQFFCNQILLRGLEVSK